jgi:hypothetical protein
LGKPGFVAAATPRIGPSVGMIDALSTSWLGVEHDPKVGTGFRKKIMPKQKASPAINILVGTRRSKKTDAAAGSFM